MTRWGKMTNTFAMNEEAGVGTVTLGVRDLSLMTDYYQQVIGLERLDSWSTGVSLGLADDVMIKLEQRHGSQYSRHSGLFHLALLLPSRPDLGQWLNHYMAATNRMIGGAGDHLVSEALYLDDPEGNGLEIYADRPRHLWEYKLGRIQMATLAVDLPDLIAKANPEPFDGLPAGSTLGHVHLQVDDVASVEQFYVEAIGLEQMAHYPGATFLGIGGYHHHIGGNVWKSRGNGQPPAGSLGLISYSFRLPSVSARTDVLDNLDRQDIAVQEVDGVPTLKDPAGNLIQLEVS